MTDGLGRMCKEAVVARIRLDKLHLKLVNTP
jgi:hypothetical protein